MLKITCLMMFALLGVGCSAMNVQRPTAAIGAMAVQDVTATGFTMTFGVDVTNPNAIPLPLKGADYAVSLGGTRVADGKATPDGTIPANGTRTIAVPVTLTYENLMTAEQEVVRSGGNVPYALDGGLSFDAGGLFGDLRVPVKTNGTLALRDIVNSPQVVLRNAAARKLAQDLAVGLLSR